MRRVVSILATAMLPAFGPLVASAAPARATTPCWTTFNPPAPQGLGMVQTYRNCNGTGYWVMPYYVDPNGNTHMFEQGCTYADNTAVVTWGFSKTVPNSSYATGFCYPPNYPTYADREYYSPRGPTLIEPCWTSFDPPDATVQVMQLYIDCTGSSVTVAPAYRAANGSLFAYKSWCLQALPPEEGLMTAFLWDYATLNPGGTYTTVFCDGPVP